MSSEKNKQIVKQLHIKNVDQNISFSKNKVLGKGAYGEVFLGFDRSRKVPCAVKTISLQKIAMQSNNQTLMKKIKDQIVNMQISKNNKIIQFFQAKKSNRNIYIICEYCNGQSLANFLQRRGYLPQNEAIQIFKEILQGFRHLRKHNIVHRDLKPANLLMNNYNIKIADLGFSKATQNSEQMLQSTVGTPLYMSPQIFQRKMYTEKTDIWSLGVILYEMLYGRNPWIGCKNLLQLQDRINKQVQFFQYPYVSMRTKSLIKGMTKVEQINRTSCQNYHYWASNNDSSWQQKIVKQEYMQEQSVESFLKKGIQWKKILMPDIIN